MERKTWLQSLARSERGRIGCWVALFTFCNFNSSAEAKDTAVLHTDDVVLKLLWTEYFQGVNLFIFIPSRPGC